MNDDITVVNINGTDYYVAGDYVDNLKVVNNRLVNVGTSNITLYGSFRVSGDNTSGYPRISVSTMQYATYQQTYQSTSQILTVNSFEVKQRITPTNTILLFVIVLALIFSWFKGR